jgi:P-type conjugative transfer protein TrbJ
MKTVSSKSLAAKVALLFAVSSLPGVITPVHAGIPVIDGSNLGQNVMTAFESVSQTLKQIQQYQTQLQQYENQLRNTLQPTTQLWDNATTTMNQLRGAIDTLDYYKTSLGSVDAYLGRFKDTAAYRASPCYSVNGCTAAEWNAMKATDVLGSESQKKANDAVFRGLDKQHGGRRQATRTPSVLSAGCRRSAPSYWIRESTGQPPVESASPNSGLIDGTTKCHRDKKPSCSR